MGVITTTYAGDMSVSAPGDTTTLARRGWTSYALFAKLFVERAEIGDDPSLAVRVLREVVRAARALDAQAEIDAFHAEPPTTGSDGWDALLAGVAVLTGAGRTTPGVLDWCDAPGRWCVELFDPLDSGKYFLLEMLRTAAPIRERNVVLAAGNLLGV